MASVEMLNQVKNYSRKKLVSEKHAVLMWEVGVGGLIVDPLVHLLFI